MRQQANASEAKEAVHQIVDNLDVHVATIIVAQDGDNPRDTMISCCKSNTWEAEMKKLVDLGYTKGPRSKKTRDFKVRENQKIDGRFLEGSELRFLGPPTKTLLFMSAQSYPINHLIEVLPTPNPQHSGELEFKKGVMDDKETQEEADISIVITINKVSRTKIPLTYIAIPFILYLYLCKIFWNNYLN